MSNDVSISHVSLRLSTAAYFARLAQLPQERVPITFAQFRNVSNYSDERLADYVEAFFIDKFVSFLQIQCVLAFMTVLGVFGIIGGIMDIFVLFKFKNTEFSSPSWTYHRFIAVVDLLGMPFQIFIGINTALPNRLKTWATQWLGYSVASPMLKWIRTIVDTAILFTSIERTMALWTPLWFRHVNTKKVCAAFCTVSVLTSALVASEFLYYDLKFSTLDEVYSPVPSAVTKTQPFAMARTWLTVLWMSDAGGSLVAAIAITFGMVKRAKYRKRAVANVQEKRDLKQTIRVSLLCLTCSVPMVINWILYAIFTNFLFGMELGETAISKLSFESSMYNLRLHMGQCCVVTTFTIASSLEHSGHFYFYYAFNPTFRAKARQLLCWRGSQVQPRNDSSTPNPNPNTLAASQAEVEL